MYLCHQLDNLHDRQPRTLFHFTLMAHKNKQIERTKPTPPHNSNEQSTPSLKMKAFVKAIFLILALHARGELSRHSHFETSCARLCVPACHSAASNDTFLPSFSGLRLQKDVEPVRFAGRAAHRGACGDGGKMPLQGRHALANCCHQNSDVALAISS